MSVRNNIIDALVTGLETIEIVALAGKPPTVSRDYRAWPPTNAKVEQAQLYVLDDGGEEITNECDDNKLQMEAVILVLGYYRTDVDLSDNFNTFLDQIYGVIYAPIDLGDGSRDCVIDSVLPIDTLAQEYAVVFHVNIKIKYVRDVS